MALVSLKDVQVVRVNRSGFGVQVKEADREQGGKTFKGDRFTVWFKESHGLTEGDTVSVSGFLSAKVGEWTDREGNARQSVELSLNSPRVDGFPSKGADDPAVSKNGFYDDASEPF
jgi:hypothetical protein